MSSACKISRLSDQFELSNGVKMPCIGLGTWQTDHETTIHAVVSAIKSGYRLIDTAAAYGNEASVGTGIRESGIDRKDIFITSKLRNAHHGYESTLEAFERTIARLGVDYLDLYLIHWPNPLHYRSIGEKATAATWKAFEELYRAKKIRAIGVSNFMPHHIDALMKTAEILPMVNQLRLCPGVTQPQIVKYCREKGILVEAYSPLGTGAIFEVPEMTKALDYIERNRLTDGYTSVLWTTEDENIGFWYENVKACKAELEACLNSSQLEQTNVLMKVRESLMDGKELTIPCGISRYPNNASWMIFGWLSFFLIMGGIIWIFYTFANDY